MSESQYNTNLAAEFYVLSVLHRLGADATLTLGNKKSVDIAVVKGAGSTATIDVKGLAGTTSWPVDNVTSVKNGHFLVFVCYNGKIKMPNILPDVWVIPAAALEPYVYKSPKADVLYNGVFSVKMQKSTKTVGIKFYSCLYPSARADAGKQALFSPHRQSWRCTAETISKRDRS